MMDNRLQDALSLIRSFIVQTDVEEDVIEVGVRAREVIKAVREEVKLIGDQMLMDFGVGPVACIIDTPFVPGGPPRTAFGSSLSFGVHTPDSATQIELGVTVTPLYK